MNKFEKLAQDELDRRKLFSKLAAISTARNERRRAEAAERRENLRLLSKGIRLPREVEADLFPARYPSKLG